MTSGPLRAAPAGAPDRLRALLAGDDLVHLPGVHDAVSARLARRSGARAVHLSGAAVSISELGVPDLGFVHGTDIARRAALVAASLDGVPVLADADTGYGNALQARHTALGYAAAGAAGLHLEDQASPKRCGHLAGKAVIGRAEAVQKVRATVDAGTALVVVARTDALSVEGLGSVVERCVAFADVGADAVFPEGAALADLEQVRAALDAAGHRLPLVWNRSEAAGPVDSGPSPAQLAEVGVRAVIHPVSALLAAARAMERVYAAIAESGSAAGTERWEWSALTGLVGQPELLDEELQYAVAEDPSSVHL
ncbi:isocitrate lyase/PEP mutase family protein [Nocardioides pantholopis]|uniref:isocitrate lyase/PEP mutase family protein n=1 Tax=Nocardioides pantholopis TaxID=2483798 RepID=UPI0019D30D2B|nr:isocitrate lyase/phosphoenolpyruvate mutase family protein [Nocardioides pantholopis]